ncbi:MAG: PEP-CTERM sorting domain-containing protein [Fimbriimonadia bacterium]|nr:PEP-CTERM sorting domain-containing protein [Fimbriimonadia bacterium]
MFKFRSLGVGAVVLAISGALTHAQPVVFSDGFESYTPNQAAPLEPWGLFAGTNVIKGNINNNPAYVHSGQQSYIEPIAGELRKGYRIGTDNFSPQSFAVMDFWMYDDMFATGQTGRADVHGGEVRVYQGTAPTGDFTNTGCNFLFAIGVNTAAPAGEVPNRFTNYLFRVVSLSGGNFASRYFDLEVPRVQGWHNFQIMYDARGAEVSMEFRYAGGASNTTMTKNFSFAPNADRDKDVDLIALGFGVPFSSSDLGTAAYDDVTLYGVPEPASMIALSAGLLGLAARRRRR